MNKLEEVFSIKRMEKCFITYVELMEHWRNTGKFACKVYCDESLQEKNLEDISKLYFEIGISDSKLTTLPFIDMLVVFTGLKAAVRNLRKGQEDAPIEIKTSFSKKEVFKLLTKISKNIGIQIKQAN